MAKFDLISDNQHDIYPDDVDDDVDKHTLFPRWWLRPPVLPCTAPPPPPFTIRIIIKLFVLLMLMIGDADADDWWCWWWYWWLVIYYEVMLSHLTSPLPHLLPGSDKEKERSGCEYKYRFKYKYKYRFKYKYKYRFKYKDRYKEKDTSSCRYLPFNSSTFHQCPYLWLVSTKLNFLSLSQLEDLYHHHPNGSDH